MSRGEDKTGRCRLCLQDNVTLMRSHIVPELLWKLTYGPTGQTLMLDRNLPYVPEVMKGIRERLFCERCEAVLESYEGKFARAWIDLPLMPPCLPSDIDEYAIAGIDYVSSRLSSLRCLALVHFIASGLSGRDPGGIRRTGAPRYT